MLVRGSASEPQEVALGVRRRLVGGSRICGRCFGGATEPTKQIGSRGMERVIGVQGQLVHERQRGSGPLHLADGDRAVEGHDRRRIDRQELVIRQI